MIKWAVLFDALTMGVIVWVLINLAHAILTSPEKSFKSGFFWISNYIKKSLTKKRKSDD